MSDKPRRFRLRKLLLPGGILSGAAALAALAGLLADRRRPTDAETEPPATIRPRINLTPGLRLGAEGAGGLFAVWPAGSENAAVTEHIEYQYAGMRHQADAALSGMWLFLVTEVLFFGGLFLLYIIYRRFHALGFAAASDRSQLLIGTINTVLLLTSSAVFAYGFGRAAEGDNRGLYWASLVTAALGIAFLMLKACEWKLDLDDNLFPGPNFAISGTDAGGAQLFWSFYFVATGLHGIHMIVGVALVAWVAWSARRLRFSAGYHSPVEVVGLYWSFVDMVWLCLYPMIYLVHRGGA
jgi:cytochrome c oxidase subunit III